jgi:DNA-binding transcriptional regulator YhcF (GntR family)
MTLKLDFYNRIPIHTQIVTQIRRLIATGEFVPGQRLPTLRDLAAELQVNFTTVARAYRTLDSEGLISTQHGRGTFVLGPPTAAGSKRLREQSLDALTRVFISESRHLGFDDPAILRAVQRGLADGENVAENDRT